MFLKKRLLDYSSIDLNNDFKDYIISNSFDPTEMRLLLGLNVGPCYFIVGSAPRYEGQENFLFITQKNHDKEVSKLNDHNAFVRINHHKDKHKRVTHASEIMKKIEKKNNTRAIPTMNRYTILTDETLEEDSVISIEKVKVTVDEDNEPVIKLSIKKEEGGCLKEELDIDKLIDDHSKVLNLFNQKVINTRYLNKVKYVREKNKMSMLTNIDLKSEEMIINGATSMAKNKNMLIEAKYNKSDGHQFKITDQPNLNIPPVLKQNQTTQTNDVGIIPSINFDQEEKTNLKSINDLSIQQLFEKFKNNQPVIRVIKDMSNETYKFYRELELMKTYSNSKIRLDTIESRWKKRYKQIGDDQIELDFHQMVSFLIEEYSDLIVQINKVTQ